MKTVMLVIEWTWFPRTMLPGKHFLLSEGFGKSQYTESSSLFIARLEAIVAFIKDGLKNQREESRMENPSQSAIQAVRDWDFLSLFALSSKQKCRQRGDWKRLDTTRSFKKYILAAVIQMLSLCCDEYQYECTSSGLGQHELEPVCGRF